MYDTNSHTCHGNSKKSCAFALGENKARMIATRCAVAATTPITGLRFPKYEMQGNTQE
jgi:hypothetical protein